MKIGNKIVAGAAGAVLGAAMLVVAGPLNPPAGPVAPTHKTLTEIEPRVVLSDANTPGDADSFYRITQSGSYYLDRSYQFVLANIGSKFAIEVDADHVTIDLRGFTMRAINNARDAIHVNAGRTNVRIINGHIDNFGLGGVGAAGATGVVVEDLSVSDCGFGQDPGAPGIDVGEAGVVRRCVVTGIGSAGRPHPGIRVGPDSVVEGCTVSLATAGGVVAETGARVTDTACTFNTGNGIRVIEGGAVSGCTASNNTLLGILITNTGLTTVGGTNLADCTAMHNGTGGILATQSTVTRCTTSFNTGVGLNVQNGAAQYCTGRGNTTHGFTGSNATFVGCVTRSNGQDGFNVDEGTVIKDCVSRGNTGDGIQALKEVSIVGCHVEDNSLGAAGSVGIRLTSVDNRVEGNTVLNNLGAGILAAAGATGNAIVANRASGNTTNYSIVAGNFVGTVVATEAAMNAAANSLVNLSF